VNEEGSRRFHHDGGSPTISGGSGNVRRTDPGDPSEELLNYNPGDRACRPWRRRDRRWSGSRKMKFYSERRNGRRSRGSKTSATFLHAMAVALLSLSAYTSSETPVRAQHSANEFIPACRLALQLRDKYGEGGVVTLPVDSPYVMAAGQCMGMVAALTEVGTVLVPQFRFCPPSGVTYTQALRVVLSYLDAHPQRTNEPLTALAVEALRAAWPCA